MATSASWGDATALLADAGVADNPSYYREFTTADQKAVLTVPMRISAAWAANDPDMFADTFVDNGSLLMGDRQLSSREEIRTYMAEAFAGYRKGAHVDGWPIAISFLSDTVAMVITEGGVVAAGETEIAPANLIRATWIVSRRPDGSLRLFSHQSSPIKS